MDRIMPGSYSDPRLGTGAEAIVYCSKEESRVSGPFKFGTPAVPAQGKRSDIQAALDTLRTRGLTALRHDHPREWIKYSRSFMLDRTLEPIVQTNEAPEVILLFGPPGCGKSRQFYDQFRNRDHGVLKCGNGFWFDGVIGGEDGLLIDDFSGKRSAWKLDQFLDVTDRYQLRVPIKGGFTIWSPKSIIVTTKAGIWCE